MQSLPAVSEAGPEGAQKRAPRARGRSYAEIIQQLSGKVDSLHEALNQLQLENRDLKLRQEVLEQWCRINRLALQVMRTCGGVLMRGRQQDLPQAAIAAIEGAEQWIQQQMVDPGPQPSSTMDHEAQLPPPKASSSAWSASCTLHGHFLSLQEHAVRCLQANPQRYAFLSEVDVDGLLAQVVRWRERARSLLGALEVQPPPPRPCGTPGAAQQLAAAPPEQAAPAFTSCSRDMPARGAGDRPDSRPTRLLAQCGCVDEVPGPSRGSALNTVGGDGSSSSSAAMRVCQRPQLTSSTTAPPPDESAGVGTPAGSHSGPDGGSCQHPPCCGDLGPPPHSGGGQQPGLEGWRDRAGGAASAVLHGGPTAGAAHDGGGGAPPPAAGRREEGCQHPPCPGDLGAPPAHPGGSAEEALEELVGLMLHVLTSLCCAQLLDPSLTCHAVDHTVQLEGPPTQAKLAAVVEALQLSQEQRAQIATRFRVVSQLLVPIVAAGNEVQGQITEVLHSMQQQQQVQAAGLAPAAIMPFPPAAATAEGLGGPLGVAGGSTPAAAAVASAGQPGVAQHTAGANRGAATVEGRPQGSGTNTTAAAPVAAGSAAADLHDRLRHLVSRRATLHRSLGWVDVSLLFAGLGVLSWEQMAKMLVVTEPYPMIPLIVLQAIAAGWEAEQATSGGSSTSSGSRRTDGAGWAQAHHRFRPQYISGRQQGRTRDEQPPEWVQQQHQQREQGQQQRHAQRQQPADIPAGVQGSSSHRARSRRPPVQQQQPPSHHHVSVGRGVQLPAVSRAAPLGSMVPGGTWATTSQVPRLDGQQAVAPGSSHACWIASRQTSVVAVSVGPCPAHCVEPAPFQQQEYPDAYTRCDHHHYHHHQQQQPQLQPGYVPTPIISIAQPCLGADWMPPGSGVGGGQAMLAPPLPALLPAQQHMAGGGSHGLPHPGGLLLAAPPHPGGSPAPQHQGSLPVAAAPARPAGSHGVMASNSGLMTDLLHLCDVVLEGVAGQEEGAPGAALDALLDMLMEEEAGRMP